jgi:phospholipase C
MDQAKTVFVILMENHNWEDIKDNAKAPFINQLLREGASADQYFNPEKLHPSEPNYIWLVSGDHFGIHNDDAPSANGLRGKNNIAALMSAKGIRWKSYQENIDGKSCPLVSNMPYAVKHNPFVFFDNLTDGFKPDSQDCIAHNRPFEELESDLKKNQAPNFVFITPNICNDMHGNAWCTKNVAGYDQIKTGDQWLSKVIPMIRQSRAYQENGVIFVTWDESEGRADKPIGLIALSGLAKAGYVDTSSHYTHSALLRSVSDIFQLPALGDAAHSQNLENLFR